MLFIFTSCFPFFVQIENARLKHALAIPMGAPMIVENDAIETLSIVTDKTINDLLI